MATSNSYDYPSTAQLVDENGFGLTPWIQWIQRTHNIVRTLNTSGPTAQRPTSVLWIGQTYFDTTINKPIWIKQVKPAVVWIDASGAVV